MQREARIGRGFDRLSAFYDAAVKLFFGRSLQRIQACLLDQMNPVQHTLVIGGGTGWVLKHLYEKGKTVTCAYADISTAMRDKTNSRLTERQRATTTFHSRWTEAMQPAPEAIVMPFVLDCLREETMQEWISIIQNEASQAVLYVIDFNEEPVGLWQPSHWQHWFIRMLYGFFRLSTGIEARSLPRIRSILEKSGYRQSKVCVRFGGWLYAAQWVPMSTSEMRAMAPSNPKA